MGVLRVVVYLFVPLDVLVTHTSGFYHGYADQVWYQPLLVGRLLPLPVPTFTLTVFIQWAVVIAALLAMTGRAPRLLGWTVFALYFEWTVIAFSYGKVDHDRFAYLVALAVLPAVGRAGLRDGRLSEAAGWALHCVQLAVVATYFYAAFAKLRFGGPEWVDSATLVRAVLRRGTELSDPLLANPWTLHLTQWGIVLMELCSPAIFFVKERWQRWFVGLFALFHLMTWSMITIIFLPHVLCLLAFLPLERLVPRRRQLRRLSGAHNSRRSGRRDATDPANDHVDAISGPPTA